jgi:hypothetical protein
MSVTLVHGHVLFPHYPDWTRGVRRQRRWQTEVDRALSGAEARVALRPKPREQLAFRVEARDPDDLARLLARVDAALKSGLACCPAWGRGLPLVAVAGEAVELGREAWADVQAGSFLFLAAPDGGETFEVVEVAEVDADTVTLTGDALGAWGAGDWAWPLLFGRPAFSVFEHRTDWHARVSVTLTTLDTVPTLVPVVVPLAITFDHALLGAAVPNSADPDTISFDYALSGAPTSNPMN